MKIGFLNIDKFDFFFYYRGGIIIMKTIMKKGYGYLIASISFYIGAIAIFFSGLDNKVALGSSLALIGIIFAGIFVSKIKKARQ